MNRKLKPVNRNRFKNDLPPYVEPYRRPKSFWAQIVVFTLIMATIALLYVVLGN